MLKIRALNRESSSDEDFPVIRREAQEEIALELYNKALRLLATGDLLESETILLSLIEENIPLLENNGGLPKSMSTLKYSCFVNVGNVYLQRKEFSKALYKYLTASELDATDVTLWYRIGKLALKLDKFRQAAYAFSKGLECSESNWPCLDQIISVLYAIGDTIGCLEYIGKALMLDADYTKGLVFRRQIYRDSPTTKKYYQLYNPDHIWEPPLDVGIDEEDEKKFLGEAQILLDRIIEVEKALESKPLITIPLPKPLENFTWISLAKTVTYLHQYITDNEMSHFTMVDVNKCMSQTQNNDSPAEMEVEESVVTVDKTDEMKTSEPTTQEPIEEEKEKLETEVILERRFSQNSETNNDVQENTPVQTDNDEEQPMELEPEEPDESLEPKNERCKPRGPKRRRDLVSELQIWGWHSKRKYAKKGKQDKDFSVEDAFNRIVPKNLLKDNLKCEKITQIEDSMNTMDLYNMYVEDRDLNFVSPIHSPKSVHYEPYFGTDRERDDVQQFWTKQRDYCDVIILIRDFVFTLSKLWHHKWPKELIPLYIEAFTMFREHCDVPEVFSKDTHFCDIRNYALATLLYGELQSFSTEDNEPLHVSLLSFLQIVSGWDEQWQEEYVPFFNRVHWLRSYIFRKEGNNDLAIRALQLVQEIIVDEELHSTDKFLLSLPNCFKCGLITNQISEKILKHLDLVTSLGTIEELFNNERYEEVAEILKLTFRTSGNHPQVGRMGRPAQLALLLHSLWFTNMLQCFVWTEVCLYEALEFLTKPTKDLDKWEKTVDKCLGIFHEIIKTETVSVVDALNEDNRCRLVESLTRIIRKQLASDNGPKRPPSFCVTPWILLHYVLVREEHRQQASKRVSHIKVDKNENMEESPPVKEDELPPSVAILFSAHEFLGPKGWCLFGQGELLHFILDTVLDRLDTPIFEPLREKIDIHIEQALFCLYQHPSKKNKVSRHLADHNVDPLPLTWERSFQLYEFYGPDCLPEFNSYKNASITADLEQLLLRIIALVPQQCDPQHKISNITDFVSGKTEEIPEPIDFPTKVRVIYYLIGDYYFKQREFNRCLKYFQMDLCINPLRLDSWACMGLSYVSQLESKLNYCKKIKSEADFLEKAKSAQICFKKALSLSPDHLMLWIEFGSFEYMVHSFCSRVLKFESENFSMEKFEYLENQKNSYLDSSGSSFEKAIALYELNDDNEPDERWLQYYILGKIAEKKQKEPSEYLQYYLTACTLLQENNAAYPEKINYHNPQHLAVEALEIHYRINASVLKYLELNEGKDISSTLGAFFKKCLSTTSLLKKAVPKPPPLPPVEKPVENVSTVAGFQDAFLNSLKNSSLEQPQPECKPEVPVVPTEEQTIRKDVTQCLDDTLTKVEEIIKAEMDIVEPVVKVEDVIMISDSEDDKSTVKVEESIAEVELPSKCEVKKDVQTLLDEMMQETMKTTEENLIDSDVSVMETKELIPSIEEVVPTEVVENGKCGKKTDSETDTDNRKTSVDGSSSSSASTSSSSSSSESDTDEDSSSSTSSSSSENENLSNNDILQLVDKCIAGLEICIIRLPQNYKALYRLAHVYFNYKGKKDYAKSKQLMLGEYKCKENSNSVNGLFSDRKTNNFFNGIWRIPSSEIDRPGSLSAHMSRCISLLLQILRATNDNKTLIELSTLLRKTPDPDKIYIKDTERLQFAEQAMTMCTQTLRSQIKNVPNMTNQQIVKVLQEIYRVYQRAQKHTVGKENAFGAMLTDVYKQFIKEKIPENVNVLELATKFCQQHKPIDKTKSSPAPPAVLRGPGLASPPVHPPPSMIQPAATATSPSQTMPLKRPGAGRPRGRPPLPKVPGQVRAPRGRNVSASASNAFSWRKPLFDQSYAYEYLKHYQEQLIKQYSQSLSISQLTQLTQYLTQGQLPNHLAGDVSKFLSGQSSSSSVKQMGGSGMSTAAAMQMMEAGIKKKELPMAGLTAEQFKYFNSMAPSTSKNVSSLSMGTKPSYPLTITPQLSSAALKKVKTHQASVAPKARPSSSTSKYSTADSSKYKQNIPTTKTSAGLQLFKEPVPTKIHGETDKTANIFMKDRPCISITPVTATLPSTFVAPSSTFMKPVTTSPTITNYPKPPPPTSTSPGKTLQEKLADKQKQQLSKQFKSLESEMFSKDNMTISPSTLMKSLNLPSIPSSLTVSKATVAATPVYSKESAVVVPKTTYNLGIPASLSVSKATSVFPTEGILPASSMVVPKPTAAVTPSFPLESGISISQIPLHLKQSETAPKTGHISSSGPSHKKDKQPSQFHPDLPKTPLHYKKREINRALSAEQLAGNKPSVKPTYVAQAKEKPVQKSEYRKELATASSSRVEEYRQAYASKGSKPKVLDVSQLTGAIRKDYTSNVAVTKPPLAQEPKKSYQVIIQPLSVRERKSSSDDDVICID